MKEYLNTYVQQGARAYGPGYDNPYTHRSARLHWEHGWRIGEAEARAAQLKKRGDEYRAEVRAAQLDALFPATTREEREARAAGYTLRDYGIQLPRRLARAVGGPPTGRHSPHPEAQELPKADKITDLSDAFRAFRKAVDLDAAVAKATQEFKLKDGDTITFIFKDSGILYTKKEGGKND